MHAAGLIPTDACETDGCRHTTKHLWWECAAYNEIRKEYIQYIARVQAAAYKYGKKVGDYIKEILGNNCFLHTGIVEADAEAADWARQKGTEGRPRTSYPDNLRIRHNNGTLLGKHQRAIIYRGLH